MEIIGLLAQIGAGLWILNVWILRFNKETEFRGGDAKNMLEEFQTYGISPPLMYLIGGTKLTLAILLIVGVWVQNNQDKLLNYSTLSAMRCMGIQNHTYHKSL